MLEARRNSLWIAVLAVVAAVGSTPAPAFETDQYLALGVEIEDSATAVNAYLNRELEVFLGFARVDRLECRRVAPRFYRYLFRGLMASRFKNFLKSDPGVDRFPNDLGYWEHLERSVYRKPWFPYFLPLSPTIRIGEVRFGLDKIGHMFGFGRRYYTHYERLRERGHADEEALRRMLVRGLRQERFFVGGWADGVFSYGDLEANFQGMMMAKNFCRGEDPYIERVEGRWRARREIDLRDYVTPSFDETYNNNHYPRPRWKRVRPILVSEYCGRYFSSAVQARMRRYEEIERPNPSKRFIREYFEKRGHNPQLRQSMRAICDRPQPEPTTTTAFR